MHILECRTRNSKLTEEEKTNEIPAILYGKDIQENIKLSLNRKEFMRFLSEAKRNCYSIPLQLKTDNKEYKVIIKDVQWHKVTTHPQHVDFFSIKELKGPINIKYNIHYLNEHICVGVKQGGKIYMVHKQVNASVNPHTMPPYLEVDLQHLKAGEKITTQFLEEKYKDVSLSCDKKATLVSIKN